MEWAAFWTAIGSIIGGVIGIVSLVLKNKSQDGRIASQESKIAIQGNKIVTLEKEHRICQEEREHLKKVVDSEWPDRPSEESELVRAMAALRQAEIPSNMADVSRILGKIRQSRMRRQQLAEGTSENGEK